MTQTTIIENLSDKQLKKYLDRAEEALNEQSTIDGCVPHNPAERDALKLSIAEKYASRSNGYLGR